MAYGIVHHFPGGTKEKLRGIDRRGASERRPACPRVRCSTPPVPHRVAGRSSRCTSRRRAGSASATKPSTARMQQGIEGGFPTPPEETAIDLYRGDAVAAATRTRNVVGRPSDWSRSVAVRGPIVSHATTTVRGDRVDDEHVDQDHGERPERVVRQELSRNSAFNPAATIPMKRPKTFPMKIMSPAKIRIAPQINTTQPQVLRLSVTGRRPSLPPATCFR